MAAPPPGADVQDGAGPPPQGSPSPEGSLRAPFPALVVGEPLVPPPAPSSCVAARNEVRLASRPAQPASGRDPQLIGHR